MKQYASIQIQAVLYNNTIPELVKALDNLANAVRNDRVRDEFLGEVTVVWGDASPAPVFNDEEIAELQKKYSESFSLVYRYFNENTGYGHGHNLMAEACSTDYIMIFNPDILVTGDYFHYMLTPFCSGDVGLTEARQTPIEHPKKYDVKTMQTPWSSGACFITPAELFMSVGGFDDKSFFMYYEDVDLSWRIRSAGKKLIYCPDAPVYHSKHIDESAKLTHTKTELRYGAEAAMTFAYKWHFDDILNDMLLHYTKGGTELQQQAAESFRKRRAAGELIRLDPSVCKFKFSELKNRFEL